MDARPGHDLAEWRRPWAAGAQPPSSSDSEGWRPAPAPEVVARPLPAPSPRLPSSTSGMLREGLQRQPRAADHGSPSEADPKPAPASDAGRRASAGAPRRPRLLLRQDVVAAELLARPVSLRPEGFRL